MCVVWWTDPRQIDQQSGGCRAGSNGITKADLYTCRGHIAEYYYRGQKSRSAFHTQRAKTSARNVRSCVRSGWLSATAKSGRRHQNRLKCRAVCTRHKTASENNDVSLVLFWWFILNTNASYTFETILLSPTTFGARRQTPRPDTRSDAPRRRFCSLCVKGTATFLATIIVLWDASPSLYRGLLF